MRRLVQITAGVAPGDAVTRYVYALDGYLKRSGLFRSTAVYAESIAGLHRVKHLFAYTPSPDDFVIYHHSVGLLYLENFLMPEVRPLVIYHNITPPQFYVPWDFRAASRMQLGQDQLQRLGSLGLRAVALSQFSAGELHSAGFLNVAVMPYPHVEAERGKGLRRSESGDGRWQQWLSESVPVVLFVGRIAPNKGIDRLLQSFALLRKSTPARLVIAGSFRSSSDRYGEYLQGLAAELGLAEDLCWAGFVSDADLASLYSKASLYLSMSEHEGFGVPLVEAMAADVPVLAYCAERSSVAEVLGGAGIGFAVPDVGWVASVASQILGDQRLRNRMLQGQRARVNELRSVDVLAGLRRIVEEEMRVR